MSENLYCNEYRVGRNIYRDHPTHPAVGLFVLSCLYIYIPDHLQALTPRRVRGTLVYPAQEASSNPIPKLNDPRYRETEYNNIITEYVYSYIYYTWYVPKERKLNGACEHQISHTRQVGADMHILRTINIYNSFCDIESRCIKITITGGHR